MQVTDRYLQERLRSAESDVASGEMQADVYAQLEAIFGELSDKKRLRLRDSKVVGDGVAILFYERA